jgi:hypothetical protein
MSDGEAARRARLAAAEHGLARLEAQYDLLLSHFKFDEAKSLRPRIEALEHEARALATTLPPLPEPPATPYTVLRRPLPRRRR